MPPFNRNSSTAIRRARCHLTGLTGNVLAILRAPVTLHIQKAGTRADAQGRHTMSTPSKRSHAIVLVHGFWVTLRSWEHWITRDEARGYHVLAPAYPGFEVEVEALNRDPSPVERLKVPAIMSHLEAVVGELKAPPILMGHSAGGAFV